MVANRTDERRVEAIAALRRLRFTGPEIAELLGMPLSTVSGILTRIGMGKLGRLGLEPAQRYERARPGELIHIDVKKLGRIVGGAGQPRQRRAASGTTPASFTDAAGRRRSKTGWEFVHVAIDDATRLAYAEVLGDETARTAVGFLRRALAFFASYGITVERVLTDNGSAYISRSTPSPAAPSASATSAPGRGDPQTNGKAERFIRTMLGGWAYGAIYRSSRERTAALDGWLFTYNHRRRHAGIGRQTPITRLNNLLGTYS